MPQNSYMLAITINSKFSICRWHWAVARNLASECLAIWKTRFTSIIRLLPHRSNRLLLIITNVSVDCIQGSRLMHWLLLFSWLQAFTHPQTQLPIHLHLQPFHQEDCEAFCPQNLMLNFFMSFLMMPIFQLVFFLQIKGWYLGNSLFLLRDLMKQHLEK